MGSSENQGISDQMTSLTKDVKTRSKLLKDSKQFILNLESKSTNTLRDTFYATHSFWENYDKFDQMLEKINYDDQSIDLLCK